MFTIQGKHSNAVVYADTCEETAVEQITELCNVEAFANSKIRIMPDCHAGKGCVVGFTADLGSKAVPNLIGVDIGCGMLTVSLEEKNIDLKKLDEVIRKYIPSGMDVHETEKLMGQMEYCFDFRCFSNLKNIDRLKRSMGTLGGGNHFIEVDKDEEENLYLIIHTGSRNLGKQVAEYYQSIAIKECASGKKRALIEKLKSENRDREISEALKKIEKIPKHLCFLEGDSREDYLHDLKLCQDFATLNRIDIAATIMTKLNLHNKGSFETIHNYIGADNIIRKGAISAKEGERVLIPINMRDGCIIGIGKGNEDWNCSAPHGAGRIMSRGKAKENISIGEYQSAMEGIYTTSVSESTLDEAPQAYKPMEEIIANVKDTVEIEKIIKPIYNFKA